jgi:MFS family permease
MDSVAKSESSPRYRNTFISLRVRNYRYLWLGVLSMMAGLQMQLIVRGYLVYHITSSSILLGLVSSGFALPLLTLALFGGAIADRFERRRIIQFAQGLGGLTSLVIAISISTGSITWIHLLVASFVNGVIFAFIVPARTSLIADLVSDDLLSNALALNAAAMSGTTLLAPAIAGNLYVVLGPDGVYYIIAALMLTAVVFTGLINHREQSAKKRHVTLLRDILAGLQYMRGNTMVVVVLALGLATALLAMPIRFLLPIFIVDIYHRGPDALGLLVSAIGIGALLGSLMIAVLGRWRRGILLIFGGCLSALGLLSIAMIPLYYVAAIIMVFLGLADATRRSLNMALLLEVTDDAYRGRVASIYTMNFGLMPLGVLPASVISKYFGPQAAAAFLGIILLIVCVTVALSFRPLRRMM